MNAVKRQKSTAKRCVAPQMQGGVTSALKSLNTT